MESTTIKIRSYFNIVILILISLLNVIPFNLLADTSRNIIFILSDDHRYDFMGFTGKIPWLKTPSMDKLADETIVATSHSD